MIGVNIVKAKEGLWGVHCELGREEGRERQHEGAQEPRGSEKEVWDAQQVWMILGSFLVMYICFI